MTSSPNDPAPQPPRDEAADARPIDKAQFLAEAEELGLPQLVFRDDDTAPPVDHELLLKLASRQLPERISRLVYRLVFSYRDWNEAFTQAMVEYNRQLRAESNVRPPATLDDEQSGST